MIPLEGGVAVVVGGRVKEDCQTISGGDIKAWMGAGTVCLVPPIGKWFVIVLSTVRIHELSRIVRVIACSLQPHGQIVIVEPFLYEFRIST